MSRSFVRAVPELRIFVLTLSLLCGMGAIFSITVHGQAPRTADQVRIGDVERRIESMAEYGDRLTRLEASAAAIKESADESRWWQRFIGVAIIGAVLERLLRSAGIRVKPGDGD